MPHIAALADIHGDINLLKSALENLENPSLLLLAGDLVYKDNYSQLPEIIDEITNVYNGPIIACFGNEEYEQSRQNYLEEKRIKWLDDQIEYIKLNDLETAIIGSRGSLDQPTYWQRKNIPEIRQIYVNRIKTIAKLLMEAKDKGRYTIILTHYAPTYKTLVGEREKIWPMLGCRKMETQIIRKMHPNIWIHGHAHKSTVHQTTINETKVYNVSLPAIGKVTNIKLGPVTRTLNHFI